MFKFILVLSTVALNSCVSTKSQVSSNSFDKIFQNYVDSGFSGSAIVIKDDKIVLQKAYGYADESKQVLNTTKTLFNVASVGKQFTAVIILKLEEMGLLNTNDYVSKYTGRLGGWKDSARIQNLLLHNSGLFEEGYNLDYTSREGFIASVANSPIESRPGEKYRYSNAGYNLLAAIVEIVSKEPFEDVLYKMIFQPAAMIYTGYPWEKRIDQKLVATGYDLKGIPQPAEPNTWGSRGPGNLLTNTDDMMKWYQAWTNENVFSKTIRDRMMVDYIPGKETFTWNKSISATGKKLLSKGGGRPDFESQVMWWPDEKVYIFFSINRDKNLRRLIFRDINLLMNKQ